MTCGRVWFIHNNILLLSYYHEAPELRPLHECQEIPGRVDLLENVNSQSNVFVELSKTSVHSRQGLLCGTSWERWGPEEHHAPILCNSWQENEGIKSEDLNSNLHQINPYQNVDLDDSEDWCPLGEKKVFSSWYNNGSCLQILLEDGGWEFLEIHMSSRLHSIKLDSPFCQVM